MGVSGVSPSDNAYNNPVNADPTEDIEKDIKRFEDAIDAITNDPKLSNVEKLEKIRDLLKDFSLVVDKYSDNRSNISNPDDLSDKIRHAGEKLQNALANQEARPIGPEIPRDDPRGITRPDDPNKQRQTEIPKEPRPANLFDLFKK